MRVRERELVESEKHRKRCSGDESVEDDGRLVTIMIESWRKCIFYMLLLKAACTHGEVLNMYT